VQIRRIEQQAIPAPHLGDLYFNHEALLVAGFVGLLIFIIFEVVLSAVVLVVRMVVLSFAHTLLVLLGFGIIFGVIGLKRDCAETERHCAGENPVSQVHLHAERWSTLLALGRGRDDAFHPKIGHRDQQSCLKLGIE